MKIIEEIYKKKFRKLLSAKIATLVFLLFASSQIWAADETFNPGAYIIDMGTTNPNFDNGLRPYGLVYDLLINHNVPVRWAIKSDKLKNQADFLADGNSYKGGSFIIPVEYLNVNVLSTISSWDNGGGGVVIAGPTVNEFTAPIYKVLTTWPRAVLDLDNGDLVVPYFTNAGIPSSAYVTAGNPSLLTDCNDIYILPHADPHIDNLTGDPNKKGWMPAWRTDLINFVTDGGYLWAACHAVSALEAFVPGANFLSVDGLLPWEDHKGDNKGLGTLPYTYDENYSGNPIMQFMGILDGATVAGSEQIYMPEIGHDWRGTTKLAIYQPTHLFADPNEATVLAYGRAFGNDNSGMVMYEAGHQHNNQGTIPERVAAQRAFFNFILMSGIDKEISVTSTVPTFVVSGSEISISASGADGTTPYTYEWSSSCIGGSFVDDESASTTYTAPVTGSDVTCVITVKVTDDCDRFTFKSTAVVVGPATGPTAVDDDETTTFNTSVDINVLTNDTEGDGTLDPTSVTFDPLTAPDPITEGTFTVDPVTGLVTFTPVSGFYGTVTIDYEVCDSNSLCDVATITVEVTITGPTAVDDATTTPMNSPVDIDALDNDTEGDAALDPTSVTFDPLTAPDPLTEGTFTIHPTTGLVTFTPVNGYTGTVDIDYEICDLHSLCSTATITVEITPLVGPTAVDDATTTPMDTPVDIDALDNDTEGDAALDPTSVTFDPLTAPDPITEGLFTVDPVTGLVTFTPVNGYTGTVDIDYEVCDLNALCSTATISVEVIQYNGPTAVDDYALAILNTPVDIDALDNDIIGDAALDPTTVTLDPLTAPDPLTEGTFTVDPITGLVTFTPVTDFLGTVTIDYTVCDLNALCSTATITVGVDTDGDGCYDNVDDYPNDPDRCFDNYYPAGGNGTLAYEDLWPGKGDYDFNDLILDYRFKTVTSGSNHIVETFGTFTIKAFGASYENGFGFQFANNNIADIDILSVTGSDLQEGFISLGANGIENGQSIPTIIVYDNTFNIMEHPGMGIGVNTERWAPYVNPETLNIYISYTQNKYTLTELDIPNFNPFIIVNLQRTVEVHLPDYLPTDLANQSIFGTVEDDTDPASGKYYKTINNLPWAINIAEPFEYPIEKVDISAAYLKFIEWAESAGVDYSDWYRDLQGYRNPSVIY